MVIQSNFTIPCYFPVGLHCGPVTDFLKFFIVLFVSFSIDIILLTANWDWSLGISVYTPRCAGSEFTLGYSMVTVVLNTKTARNKGVLRRDNALSAYRL